jgi:hypothetical protein
LFSLNPFISGFWNSEQFEMVDVANFPVRVDCATRIPSAEQSPHGKQCHTNSHHICRSAVEGDGGARDIVGEML